MKKNYYELQMYVPLKGYVTVYAYYGTRSNANRKFRMALSSMVNDPRSCVLRVCTYSSLDSMISGESPIRQSSFDY